MVDRQYKTVLIDLRSYSPSIVLGLI